MIQKETLLATCDNSGAKLTKCISVSPYKTKQRLLQLATVAVQRIVPNNARKIRTGDVSCGVVVHSAQWSRNKSNFFVKSNANRVVMLKKKEERAPNASRVFTKVPATSKKIGLSRVGAVARGLY